MLQEIKDRAQVKLMVTSFYSTVKEDELLNPILGNHLFDDEMQEEHFEKLTDFWESALHGKRVYNGRPGAIHLGVDMKAVYKIERFHFERWLELWRKNINDQFCGEHADRAIALAENLAVNFLRNMTMNKR